ncbi:MAG: methylthioribulose 1-phosphate dehydratase [Proteobacteria bacterium]|nr:methylthioribulose 1-phosphate dehydratase [Pseudomonadota bacterium]
MHISRDEREAAARQLAATAAEFHRMGWMWGTSGNLSHRLSRDPLEFLVTSSGRPKGQLTPADMLLTGADGVALETWTGRPSAEMPVHERIYRRYDAGAVYHVHTVMGATISDVFGDAGGLELEGLEMLKGFGHPAPEVRLRIPIVDNDADSNIIADRLEGGATPGVPGVLIRNHGLYAWGRTPDEARAHVEVFEYLFSYVYHRATLKAALKGAG